MGDDGSGRREALGYAKADTPGDASAYSHLELWVLGVIGFVVAAGFGGGAVVVYHVASGGTWRAVHVSAGVPLAAVGVGVGAVWGKWDWAGRAFGIGVGVAGVMGLVLAAVVG